MNTIKFRLRDENKKIIGYEYFTQGENLSGHWHYDFFDERRQEWFQNFKWITKIRYKDMFTGLKDRNNKEVYENDIVRYVNTEGIIYINIVNFDEGNLQWNFGNLSYNTIKENAYFTKNMYLEVIGDVYNNPELLKEN